MHECLYHIYILQLKLVIMKQNDLLYIQPEFPLHYTIQVFIQPLTNPSINYVFALSFNIFGSTNIVGSNKYVQCI